MTTSRLPVRARRAARVRPYIDHRPAPAQPDPATPESPVSLGVLQRVRDGLRALDTGTGPSAPRPQSRAEYVQELAGQLRPLAWRARLARPEAWAPAEDNAPHPDVTTTAPLLVVGDRRVGVVP